MSFILRTLGRLVLVVLVLAFVLFLWRPAFVVNAGNALIHAAGNSTAYGSAMVVPSLKGNSGDIQVSLQGLTSNVRYVITLNQGSCDGAVLKTFTTVTADGSGDVANSFSLTDLKLATQPNLWINVHEGSSTGATVACGQVQSNNNLLTQAQPAQATPVKTTKADAINRVPTASTSGFSNSATDNFGDGNVYRRHFSDPDFPSTGVAPGDNTSYDDYKGPHKY